MSRSAKYIEDTERFATHNYYRLPLVAEKANGVWVYDADGCRYMDLLATYSANSCGHNHPRIISAVCDYIRSGFVTSMPGGFYNVPFAKLVKSLTGFCGMSRVLLKSGGSEAFEAAMKIGKRWGYQAKEIQRHEQAEIIACENNFHGRMLTAIALSTVLKYKKDFGPFPPGLSTITFGDPDALGRAIKPNTAVFVVEPIQSEGGINIPPDGYFKEVAKICRKNNVLLVFDEIQTGFGRTGYNFAYEYEGFKPDILIIAKTLGGGLMPVSAVLADDSVMDLIGPGDEGSTFGSHPLSCVAALETIEIFKEEKLAERAMEMGSYFMSRLKDLGDKSPLIKEVRGRGLLVGVELVPGTKGEKYFCGKLLEEGIICESARENVIRFSPPLIILREEIDWAMERIERVFRMPERI